MDYITRNKSVVTRICNRCNTEYPLNNFYKHKSNAGGYRPQCKPCLNYMNKSVWKNSRAEAKQNKKKYVCTEEQKEKNKLRRRVGNRGPEYALAQKLWRQKYYADPQRNLARAIRRRLYMARKAQCKTGKTLEYLGCSWADLKVHLEKQFKPGMTWENYGVSGWHIDHIIPLCAFDLTKEEELKKACHYTNLRPLWGHENLAKITQDKQYKKKA